MVKFKITLIPEAFNEVRSLREGFQTAKVQEKKEAVFIVLGNVGDKLLIKKDDSPFLHEIYARFCLFADYL